MKKSVVLMLVFALVMAIMMPMSMAVAADEVADSPELLQLADLFNNCSTVKDYKESCEFIVSVSGNKLSITLKYDETTESFDCILDGNILSATFGEDNTMSLIAAVILVDCVGQMNGYEDGELFYTLNSDEINEYTLDKEGFEAKDVSGGYELKVDITKKIPLVDLSGVYLTTDDLDAEIIAADSYGSVNGNKTKLAYYILVTEDGNNEIHIGEENEATISTYKSILSAIEVMFGGKDAVDYFTKNYADISEGDKDFTGFQIKTNAKNDNDVYLFEDKIITKVLVDKKLVKDLLKAEAEASYKFSEGGKQTYTIGEDESATFKIDVDYVLFENGGTVYVDDKPVSADNYTSKSGSTVITFKKEYMDALSEGEHTLKVVFGNNNTATTKFTVANAPVETTGAATEDTAETEDTTAEQNIAETDDTTKSPTTGDNSSVVYIMLALISLLGMAVTVTVSKKSDI